MHTALITVHAAAGVAALATGALALRRRRWFATFAVLLVVALVALAAVVAADWQELDPLLRAVYAAFLALGAVMLLQAERARRARPGASAYVDGIGFTLVALTDGFVVVAVLDLGAPTWALVAVGIAVALAGHLVLRRLSGSAAVLAPSRGRAGAVSPAWRQKRT